MRKLNGERHTKISRNGTVNYVN